VIFELGIDTVDWNVKYLLNLDIFPSSSVDIECCECCRTYSYHMEVLVLWLHLDSSEVDISVLFWAVEVSIPEHSR